MPKLRPPQGPEYPPADAQGPVVVDVGYNDDELVAAVAVDQVVAPEDILQEFGDTQENLRPDEVAVVVVDIFEAVDVEEEDVEAAAVVAKVSHRFVQVLAQFPLVVQPGHVVPVGQVAHGTDGPELVHGPLGRLQKRAQAPDEYLTQQDGGEENTSVLTWSPCSPKEKT